MTQINKPWLYNLYHDNAGGVCLVTRRVMANSKAEAERKIVKIHGPELTTFNLEEGEFTNDGETAISENHKPSLCEYEVRVGQAGVQTFIYGELLAYNLGEARCIISRRVKQLGKNFIRLKFVRWKR